MVMMNRWRKVIIIVVVVQVDFCNLVGGETQFEEKTFSYESNSSF